MPADHTLRGFETDHRIEWIEPARLTGWMWSGTYEEAAQGPLQDLIARVYEASGGPVLGLSRNDRPDGFRYLVAAPGAAQPDDALPPATSWNLPGHFCLLVDYRGPAAGVTEAYARMSEAIEASDWRARTEVCHHREDHGRYDPFADPLQLTLGIPVERRNQGEDRLDGSERLQAGERLI